MIPTLETLAAPPSFREIAKRELRGNRGRHAVLLLSGMEIDCMALELDGIVYALVGPALHVGAAVRWL